ncbi:MAG TPA: hypothetical protein VMO78_10225 [Rhizomicrobium sp.]|nr:hypothetical protein [Rhizomicrobium sp.]
MEGRRFRRHLPFRSFTLDFVEHDLGLVISLEQGQPGRPSLGPYCPRPPAQ